VTDASAVVALRGGRGGKSRLAGVLAPADRTALVVALARHVVATLAAADGVARVLVVTADPAFATAALAGVPGDVHVLVQPPDRRGLDAAVDLGRAAAAEDPAADGGRLLVVHADLPALGADDVAALLAAPGPVALAADRLGTGTNAVALGPGARPFRFRFGPGSLAAHRAEAGRRGWDAQVVRRPGTAVDLDTADDWAALPLPVRRRLVAQVPALARLDGPR